MPTNLEQTQEGKHQRESSTLGPDGKVLLHILVCSSHSSGQTEHPCSWPRAGKVHIVWGTRLVPGGRPRCSLPAGTQEDVRGCTGVLSLGTELGLPDHLATFQGCASVSPTLHCSRPAPVVSARKLPEDPQA